MSDKMVKRMGSQKAREKFSELVGNVHYKGQVTIIERSGKPMVAVIPIEMYDQLVAEREARFEVIDHIRSRQPDVPTEIVEKDVGDAIEAIRSIGATGSP